MSTAEFITLFWLLPSLVTCQVLIFCFRYQDRKEPHQYNDNDWTLVLSASALYPLALIAVAIAVVVTYGPREITFRRKKTV
jgi:hypothetical protein